RAMAEVADAAGDRLRGARREARDRVGGLADGVRDGVDRARDVAGDEVADAAQAPAMRLVAGLDQAVEGRDRVEDLAVAAVREVVLSRLAGLEALPALRRLAERVQLAALGE